MAIQEIAVRLVLAAVLGGLIGIERQRKHHPVGMRTNVLVCISAAMVMILSQLITQSSFELYGSATDPRLGAQVITGIGFLGAGTIMHANSTIRGLTTAASLWSVACIGLAIGAGYYELGVLTCLLVLIVLSVLNYITKQLSHNSSPKQVIITASADPSLVLKILDVLKTVGVDINEVETRFTYKEGVDSAELAFVSDTFTQREKVLRALDGLEGITELRL